MQQVENANVGTLPKLPSVSATMPNKWLNVGTWGLQILMALVFLGAGAAKLAGAESMVEQFEKIGIGQWFRYLTGAIEISGAVALLIPRFSGFGALLLGGTMIGAIFTHLFVFGNSPAAPLILLALLTSIIWARRDTVLQIL